MHNNIAFIFKQPYSEYISLRENKIKLLEYYTNVFLKFG